MNIRGLDIEGVSSYALPTRPLSSFMNSIESLEEKNRDKFSQNIPKVVVVGGGAAGIELTWAFKARFEKKFGGALVSSRCFLFPS
jgi:NADH dehydrogenase FAD-containing subunit